MKLLVIIVTYNAMQWAERCFNSLRLSSVKPDVFVVDNGSTDGTIEYLQNNYPEIIIHKSETNCGFGKANNIGMQYSLEKGYDFVYLLNQDAWVAKDTFEKLIEISKNNPEYGILSPFQMNADQYKIDSLFIAHVLSWESNPDICSDMYNQSYNEVYPVKFVMAAHWLITRDCLCRIGGFSPSFPHYAEDVNYIDRVIYHGLKIGVIPMLRVVHDRGGREESDQKKMYLGYTNSIRAISNPNGSIKKMLFRVLYICLINMIIYKSAKPLIYLLEIIKHLNSILKNRKLSMTSKSSFLK